MTSEALERRFRAANYLSAGQLFLKDNVLLDRPLKESDIKPIYWKNHWGTIPGINLAWTHLAAAAADTQTRTLFVCGPGHGAPALNAQAFLEGSYTECYPNVPQNLDGIAALFSRYSFPGGTPSHTGPDLPGSIHEGGELGYALAHAFGAAFDNPGLVVACLVGDGEAETGPMATSWNGTAFLNPKTDGAVLPILHLNGAKIHNPTLLSTRNDAELAQHFAFYNFDVRVVTLQPDADPLCIHDDMQQAVRWAYDRISALPEEVGQPQWPMIIMRTPKGWTGPTSIDGQQIQGTWRSHQIPFNPLAHPNGKHLDFISTWLRSYRVEELIDPTTGFFEPTTPPEWQMSRSDEPLAAPELVLPQLAIPPDINLNVDQSAGPQLAAPKGGWPERGTLAPAADLLSHYLSAVAAANPQHFIITCPDEAKSCGFTPLLQKHGKRWMLAQPQPPDPLLSADGRVFEVLSEHLCEAWLEGYVLTHRHGVFVSYEAFINIVDSMLVLHLKWLQMAASQPWRRSVPALNVLAMSHCWRQLNHFSHQDPSIVDRLLPHDHRFWDAYYPPDGQTAVAAMELCLASTDRVNIVVAGKQPSVVLSDGIALAHAHVQRGLGIVQHHTGTSDDVPALVLVCIGEVMTGETLAAVELLCPHHCDPASIRVVNLVRLLALDPNVGLSRNDWEMFFPVGVPIIWAFHGHPDVIYSLLRERQLKEPMTVLGYRARGAEPTTPFGLLMLNEADRYTIAETALSAMRFTALPDSFSSLRDTAKECIQRTGLDLPELSEPPTWNWHLQ